MDGRQGGSQALKRGWQLAGSDKGDMAEAGRTCSRPFLLHIGNVRRFSRDRAANVENSKISAAGVYEKMRLRSAGFVFGSLSSHLAHL
jgi:hypothetical protein